MTTIAELWQSIETHYNNGTFPADQLEKIDELLLSDDIENIRNGLTLMTTSASEYLCRYLKLDGESMVLRDAGRFGAPLLTQRVLVESVRGQSLWQDLYESGAFESMELRALGDVAIENLSESEKDFCVRIAKEMVRVPAGEFMMGALEDDEEAYDREKPRHKVILTRDFLIGKYAVTQALWESVMGSNPSFWKGANRPVEQVSWFDCVLFCNNLSLLEGFEPIYDGLGDYQAGDDQNMDEDEIDDLSDCITCNWNAKGYRLPTEAEWECSARGGEYHKYAGSDNVDEVAWYRDNSGYALAEDLVKHGYRETHPVGQKKSNGFGLYDMSGNVWEWVWGRMLYREGDPNGGGSIYSHGPVTDPHGSAVGCLRVYRGGGCYNDSENVRSSRRNSGYPKNRWKSLGFRIERSL